MSFYSASDDIQEGDTVIIYSSRQQLNPLVVQRGHQLQSRYGHFKHDQMIGKPYGSKFASANGRGFVYLLKPTPELWTLALPHRTQILYLPDIAFITSYLDIKAGSKVIEAGTGSGSFSHAIARSVGKTGKIHSFEFHEERYTKAKDEFLEHGLDNIITLKHQNVYKDGFELQDEVDSVFLDLPAPWEAIGHAKEALRKDRQSRICCFSPCIEQVLRTVSALAELGFSDITMYEALTRDHEPAVTFLPDVAAAIERIQGHEAKKERRREGQIAEAQRRREEKEKAAAVAAAASDGPAAAAGGKRKREDEEDEEGEGEGAEGAEETKKVKGVEMPGGGEDDDVSMDDLTAGGASTTNASTPAAADADSAAPPSAAAAAASPLKGNKPSSRPNHPPAPVTMTKVQTFRAGAQTKGHTSYLTFATLLPRTADEELAAPVLLENASAQADLTAEEDDFPLQEGEAEALLAVDLGAAPAAV